MEIFKEKRGDDTSEIIIAVLDFRGLEGEYKWENGLKGILPQI